MQNIEINRCLHCGGEGVVKGRKRLRVVCKKCGAQGPVKPMVSQAIEAWNRSNTNGSSSIGQERRCFLCGRNGSVDPLDRHHVFGGALRDKSEKYGLVVDLCHNSCHIFGKYAVHNNASTRDLIQKWAQKKAMEENGWSKDDFIREFGKNYL